jgi:intein/homing endonuclease
MARLTPQQWYDKYRQGYEGALWNQKEFDYLMSTLKYPLFGDASKKITSSGKGKLSTPYKSVYKFDSKPYEERQTTGDCLTAGTQVQMSDGSFKNIEDITVGEYVITHNNRSKKVYGLINKKPTNNIINHIEIKKYNKTISTTNDHKVVVFNDSGYQWVEAQDLKEGDLLVLPTGFKNHEQAYRKLSLSDYIQDLEYEISARGIRVKGSKNTLPHQVTLSDDLMWLFGIYAAEGGIDGNNQERITFNLHIKEIDIKNRIIFLMKEIFGARCTEFNRPDNNVTCVRCSNIIVARLFHTMVTGNQWNKKLNNILLQSNKYNKLSFLRGWIDGDGHIITNRRRKITSVSVSQDLINDISNILISLQIQHTIINRKARGKSKPAYQIDIYGEQVYKIFPEFTCTTKVKQQTKQNKLTCTIGLLAPISNIIQEEHTDNVYCINVEDDHSFIANGIAVHNCVSHGTRNACDISRAVEIDIEGERESWIARGATEAIYGARGWSGEGMTGSKAAEFVSKIGGILVRKNYKGVVDLTKYNGSLGAKWGGRGVPDDVLDLANDHQIKTVSLVRTIEEARDALANGYGIAVCSNYGFSSKRDSKGFAKPSGSWAHCMAFIACDDTLGDTAFLVQNSWGKWNDGGHPEWGPIPDGSFLIHSDVAQGMLSQNGSYAFSNFNGFPLQKLPDYGFDSYL